MDPEKKELLRIKRLKFYSAFAVFIVPLFIFSGYLLHQAAKPLEMERLYGFGRETVDDVTIKLLSQARELKNATADERDEKLETLLKTASHRKELILKAMENDPAGVSKIAISKELRNNFLADIKEFVEEDVILEGELEVLVSESFDEYENENDEDHPEATYYYNLIAGEKITSLHFTGNIPEIYGGSKLKVKGIKLDNKMIVAEGDNSYGDSITVVSEPTTTFAASQTVRKVALLRINFELDKKDALPEQNFRNNIFTASRSVKNFIEENSFGKWTIAGKNNLDGDYYGVFTIPGGGDCNYGIWANEAKKAATAAGADLTGYNHLIFYLAGNTGCKWAGLAAMPGTGVWLNNTDSSYVIAHELGHNFGVHHASSLSCTDDAGAKVAISDKCTFSEYGDPYTTMGGAYRHKTSFNKAGLQWLSSNVQTVTGNGSYEIVPMEKASTSTQVIRIPKEKDSTGKVIDYYYLEYRQPFGFDTFNTNERVDGVFIRVSREAVTSKTFLLDTTPTSSSGFSDAALTKDRTFYDSKNKIAITTTAVAPEKVTVKIEFGLTSDPSPDPTPTPTPTPTCTRNNPSISISPTQQWGIAGQELTYSITLRNNDSLDCTSSTFRVDKALPAGFTQNTDISTTLAPGTSFMRNVIITSPITSMDGIYSFTQKVVNTASTAHTATDSANYNVFTPDSNPPQITITGLTDGQTVGSKGNLKVSATASDPSGIARIEVYLNNNLLKVCTNVNKCDVGINLSKLSSGSHVLRVNATDKDATPNTASTYVAFTKR
jgi:hypothetical protein